MKAVLNNEWKMLAVSALLAIIPGFLLFLIFMTIFSYPGQESVFTVIAYVLLCLGGIAGSLASMRVVYLVITNNKLGSILWKVTFLSLPCMFISCVYMYALLIFITAV